MAHKVVLLEKQSLCNNRKSSKANFIIANTEGADGILGIDWLKENNAVIDTK